MTMKRTKPQDRYNKTSAKQRDIFCDTLFAKKCMAKERFQPTTYWLGNRKKFQATARIRTQDLENQIVFTSSDKLVEMKSNLR